jgi:Adenosine specific kinase
MLLRVPWRRLLPGQRPERDQNGPEVCRIFCETANPVEVVVTETDQGSGVLGAIDGLSPKGIESEEDIACRKICFGSSATSCEQRKKSPTMHRVSASTASARRLRQCGIAERLAGPPAGEHVRLFRMARRQLAHYKRIFVCVE